MYTIFLFWNDKNDNNVTLPRCISHNNEKVRILVMVTATRRTYCTTIERTVVTGSSENQLPPMTF